MADTLAQPLAEALVTIKLKYNQTDVKKQTKEIIDDQSKAFKNQIAGMKKEVVVLGQIGREIGSAARTMFKYFVLPTVLLGAGGVTMFMKTTDKDAKELKLTVHELTDAWKQFLARVGDTINKSGVLAVVLKHLINALNSFKQSDIRDFFTRAKWAIVIWGLMAATGWMIRLTSETIKAVAALATLQFMIARGGSLSTIAFMFKSLSAYLVAKTAYTAAIKRMPISDIVRSKSGIPLTAPGSAAETSFLAMKKAEGRLGFAKDNMAKVFEPLVKFGSFLIKLLGVLAKALIAFDIAAAILRGFGFRFKDGVDVILTMVSYLGKSLMFIVNTIDWITSLLLSGFESVAAIFKTFLSKDFWTNPEKSQSDLLDKLLKIQQGVVAKRPWARGGGEEDAKKEFEFANKKIFSTSFAGLNKAAQDMITQDNLKNAIKANTEAVNKNTESRKGANGLPFVQATPFSPNNPFTNPNGWAPGAGCPVTF